MIDLLTPEQEADLRKFTGGPYLSKESEARIWATLDATRAENERLKEALSEWLEFHEGEWGQGCECVKCVKSRAALNSAGGRDG